jgi:hypothetical protein
MDKNRFSIPTMIRQNVIIAENTEEIKLNPNKGAIPFKRKER